MKKISLLIVLYLVINLGYSQGSVINKGVLKIESGTSFYTLLTFENDLTGSLTNKGDLVLGADYQNKGTTTATIGTTSLIGVSSQRIYFDETSPLHTININNLVINNSSSTGVSVDNNYGLIVQGNLTLTNGDLRLVGESQLVQGSSSTLSAGGSGSLLRDRQAGANMYGYNYFSSPVNNSGTYALNSVVFDGTDASINSFTPQLIQFNSGTPYSGTPSVVDSDGNVTSPLAISDRWLYTYFNKSGAYSEWIYINPSSLLSPGQGYTMKGTGADSPNQNYVFKGKPNNGNYEFSSILLGNNYLLGNPYPSALDADQFIADNNAIDAIYIWVDGGSNSHYLSNYLGSYATRNLTGGTTASIPVEISGGGNSTNATPGQYIAVGQGFFVEAVSNDPIVFNNSQRAFVTETAGDSQFYRQTYNKDAEQKSLIRLGYENPEGFHRQLLLGFIPNSPANLNFNNGYDAFMNGLRADDMYFIIDDDFSKQYVIQGVGTYDITNIFPIGVLISEEGTHTIMVDEVENFTDDVYLYDNVLEQTYNISQGEKELNLEPGEYLDRFKIVFQNSLGVNDASLQDLKVFYDNNNHIIVNNRWGLEINTLTVYNTLGQELLRKKNLRGVNNLIPFQHPKALYVIVVETDKGKKSYKIIN
ncbi:T9SS type A sorting domain-containing protein [Flavobacteriaceae sp. LMIT009]